MIVGREQELRQLDELMESARRGAGGLAVVEAEPGGGKTRLLREVRAHAETAGMATAWGAAWESGAGIPYLAVAAAINDLLDAGEPQRLQERLGRSAEVLGWITPRLGSPRLERLVPEQKPVLFEAVARLLALAGDRRGLALFVDDAHWADPSSLELLEYLARRAGRLGVAVLAGWRDAPGLPTSEPLRRVPTASLVRLRPLSAAEVAELAGALAPVPPSGSALRALTERSRGNPLLVERLVLAGSAGGMPVDVRQAMLGAAAEMTGPRRRALEAAAVIGGRISSAAVAEVTASGREASGAALRALAGARLLDEEGSGGAYRFHHQLIRDAVYAEIPEERRIALHSRVADARAQPPSSAERGRHLLAAGRLDEAVEVLGAAAEEAMSRGGHREASALYRLAAEAAGEPAVEGDLLCRAGNALNLGHVNAGAVELMEAGVALLERAGVTPGARRTNLAFAYGNNGLADKAYAAGRAAMAELEPAGPSADLAYAEVMLGIHHEITRLEPEEALIHAERALRIAEQVGDERDAALAQGLIAGALGSLDRVEEAIRLGDEASRRLLAIGELSSAVVGIHNFANMRAHVLRAREALEERVPLFDQPPLGGNFSNLKARICGYLFTALGRFDEVLALADPGEADFGLQLRLRWMRPRALAELDRRDEAREALLQMPPPGHVAERMIRSRLFILTALALDEPALALAEAVAQPPTGMGFFGTRFYVEPNVEAAMSCGRREVALGIIDALRPLAVAGDPYWELMLARVGERPASAAIAAADAFAGAGYAPDACRALLLAAEQLEEAGDRPSAVELMRRMLEVAKAGRLPRLRRVARERLHAMGADSDLATAEQVRHALEQLHSVEPTLRARLETGVAALVAAGGREGEAGVVLRDYYVKKIGSQEVVAERHFLTRPTFYRRLHLGWELLAERLGPLEETPAGSAPGS
ncbi:MAG TPA: AAA family ATPase [Candidatus Dormibacteraeota bacterium]